MASEPFPCGRGLNRWSSVPVNLTSLSPSAREDFFGRVVVKRAAAPSAGVCGGVKGEAGWKQVEE